MSTTIVMPQLGESVAEGVIGKWLKSEGEAIERDEPIVEIITDKVNAEIPSPVAGVVEKITQPEGATVAVGQEIAIIGDGGAAGKAPRASTDTESGQAPPPSSATAANSEISSDDNGHAPGRSAVATAPAALGAVSRGARAERVRSSPLVRRLAEESGINLTEVPGTGIGGRVSKADILSFIERRQVTAAETPTPPLPSAAPPPGQEVPGRPVQVDEEIVPVSPVRKMIADRMLLSKTTIPHATTIVEVDVSNVVRFRDSLKDKFRQREGVPLSLVAFVIKATVEALKQYPDVNAEWRGDHIVRKQAININVAVDAPDGLITPVIHHADEKSLAGLSKAIYDVATRARNKKLRVEDMQGGTFTVNNTGALGSVWSMSIINPPQGGILAAAAVVKRPVVVEVDGQDLIAVRSMMNLSFSFDHRLLDGGYAASFVDAVKRTLETWPQTYSVY